MTKPHFLQNRGLSTILHIALSYMSIFSAMKVINFGSAKAYQKKFKIIRLTNVNITKALLQGS